jgi:hypothetical protein
MFAAWFVVACKSYLVSDSCCEQELRGKFEKLRVPDALAASTHQGSKKNPEGCRQSAAAVGELASCSCVGPIL